MHGAHLAELLEIPNVIIPRYAATYSAFGMLNMEVGRDFARSIVSTLKFLDLKQLNAFFAEMEVEARQVLGEIGISQEDTVHRRSLDMRYVGQFHEVEVSDVPLGTIGPAELQVIMDSFHRRHKELYTFNIPDREVEFLNARLKATAKREVLSLEEIPAAPGDISPALKRKRACLWNLSKGFEETCVYDGSKLAAGHIVPGPAVIEESKTTIVIPATFICRVDGFKNYILKRR